MNKHKRSKMLPMTRIWRRKAKRVPSSSKERQERLSSEITNKETLNLSINSPHQAETSSKHLEEALKIEEIHFKTINKLYDPGTGVFTITRR